LNIKANTLAFAVTSHRKLRATSQINQFSHVFCAAAKISWRDLRTLLKAAQRWKELS